MIDYKFLMTEALKQAEAALAMDEVPIGAVISNGNDILAKGHNLVEKDNSATKHAEIIVIDEASKKINDWRLSKLILTVTLEPCTMCLGAIKNSRISTLSYSLDDPRLGAAGSVYDLSIDQRIGPEIKVIRGIYQSKSLKLLQNFFKDKRGT